MRVTRDDNGKLRVEDEPMRLEGNAAEQFLSDMEARERGQDGDRTRFLDDCRRTYNETVERSGGISV